MKYMFLFPAPEVYTKAKMLYCVISTHGHFEIYLTEPHEGGYRLGAPGVEPQPVFIGGDVSEIGLTYVEEHDALWDAPDELMSWEDWAARLTQWVADNHYYMELCADIRSGKFDRDDETRAKDEAFIEELLKNGFDDDGKDD